MIDILFVSHVPFLLLLGVSEYVLYCLPYCTGILRCEGIYFELFCITAHILNFYFILISLCSCSEACLLT